VTAQPITEEEVSEPTMAGRGWASSLAMRHPAAGSTHDRILLAALDCIAEEGIARTSTRAIARRAGVKQGVIHHHFASKDALLLALLRALFENSRQNVADLAESALPPRERLLGIIDLGFSLIGPRGPEFTALIAYWAHAMAMGGAWREAYRRAFEGFRSTVVQVVEEGERAGEFRPGLAAMVAAMLVAIVQGIGLQVAIAPDRIDRASARAWARQLVATMLVGETNDKVREPEA